VKGWPEKAVPLVALILGGLGFACSITPLIIAGVLLAAVFVALNVASIGPPSMSRGRRKRR
jgi:hypothetical protein